MLICTSILIILGVIPEFHLLPRFCYLLNFAMTTMNLWFPLHLVLPANTSLNYITLIQLLLPANTTKFLASVQVQPIVRKERHPGGCHESRMYIFEEGLLYKFKLCTQMRALKCYFLIKLKKKVSI